MIKFFRKIRQRLLTENKFSKYLIYAIGEIVLVMIGILLALQVNNWNENRKAKIQELKILQNLKKSLEKDSKYTQWSIETYDLARNSMDYLIEHMEKDLPYKDSLKYHFANMTFDWGLKFDFSSYEELKSIGSSIISNDSLRSNIIGYYTFAEGVGMNYTKRYTSILENASKMLFPKHFDQMWNSRISANYVELPHGEMIPFDYEVLKKDNEFRYFLKTLKNQNFWLIDKTCITVIEGFTKISSEIEKEISVIKK
jgi:hypothetical protein